MAAGGQGVQGEVPRVRGADHDDLAGDALAGREEDRAAVVYSGVDVYAYGFVPHHDLVYVVSHDGTYFVPFERSKDRP